MNNLNNNIYVSVINIISIFIILVLAILCLFCSKLYNISGLNAINYFNDRENYKSSLELGTVWKPEILCNLMHLSLQFLKEYFQEF